LCVEDDRILKQAISKLIIVNEIQEGQGLTP